jgi:hypothetical protein
MRWDCESLVDKDVKGGGDDMFQGSIPEFAGLN